MKFSLLTTAVSVLALGQHALASPVISARQDEVRSLKCDLGGTSIEADTEKCAAATVVCKGPLGVVITSGTSVAYNCLLKCKCE
ncbi:hypothetical protein QBC40DRAFT_269089 [Triangularia verruculosa]|uniref:Uncharacterized protein n=1 Tax=Triangularia verruculosa TaxID=2587418 RepID=A0AAN7ANU3_9PEZI|nr:hypothetical protein QBC40DRAFT_269089 [Triangularia verruculosa]